MEGRELRRSYTQMDIPVSSRNKQHHHQYQHGKNSSSKKYGMSSSKSKTPAMELYKPPNQRDPNAGPKLNVHAKEFNPLQNSRSAGTMLESADGKKFTKSQNSRSSKNELNNDVVTSNAKQLQKSKSTGSALHNAVQTPNVGLTAGQMELFDSYSERILIARAVTDLKSIPWLDLIDTIPRIIIGKALRDRSHAQSFAHLCIVIIERDSTGTFLESLLNGCRYTLQNKCMVDNTSRYHAFIAFLNELYSLVRQHQIQHKANVCGLESPVHTVLHLIVQVCQSILQQKSMHVAEVECMFFTITTIGKDLETEDPRLLDQLMSQVRDTFLNPSTPEPIRRTLLQLIELRASRWTLPLNAFIFYAKQSS